MEKNEDLAAKDIFEEDFSEINDVVFDEPDTDENIQLESSTGRIKLISFGKLIEKLTSANQQTLLKSVLLTYRSFRSSKGLLLALIKRFETAPGIDRKVVQLRVLLTIKLWISSHWSDFNKDLSILLPILERFLNRSSKSDQITVEALKAAINSISVKLHAQLNRGSKPRGIDYSEVTMACSLVEESDPIEMLNYIRPKELADHITALEWEVWSKIQPSELVNLNWTKKNKHETSPNILKFISIFNLMTKWVSMSVLTVEDFDQRVLRLEYWILTAKHLVDLHNFNAGMAVVAGLQSMEIYRLQNTCNAIHECRQIFNGLTELFDYSKSYKHLREQINNATPPCIPYLGMYLTELTFVVETGRDSSGIRLIEWAKYDRTANIIQQIQTYQSVPYTLTSGTFLQQKIESFVFFAPDELMECSYYIEPRAGVNRPKPACLTQYQNKNK